ncbi:MAG: TolC family protein [Bdellovibrionia bacterium]
MRALHLILIPLSLMTSALAGAGETPLGFDQALNQIMARSTQIGAQREAYESLESANLPTRLFYLPTISTNAKVSYNGDPSSVRLRTARHAEVQADLNIFRFGADYTQLRAAQNDEAQQKEVLSSTILQTEDQAVQALIEAIRTGFELDVLRRQVKVREEALQIAQKRYERGFLAEQEVRKVLIDVSNAQSRLAQGELSSIEANSTLRSLLGPDPIAIQWPWKTALTSAKADELTKRFKFDLKDRPDWAAAQARLTANEYRRTHNYLLMLPSLDASITYGYYKYDFDAGAPNGPAWQGAFVVTLPIFDRLVNLSNGRAQAHLVRQAAFQQTEVERNADAQVSAAKQSLLRAVTSAAERDTTLSKSMNLYQDSLRRFQNGRADTNEMLLDQTRVLDTELLAISGWSEAHLALARFCHSLGKRVAECLR